MGWREGLKGWELNGRELKGLELKSRELKNRQLKTPEWELLKCGTCGSGSFWIGFARN